MTDWSIVWPESIDAETGEDAEGVVRGPINAGDQDEEQGDDE